MMPPSLCALDANGASHCWGLNDRPQFGTPHCWGWNRFGQVGDGTTIDRLTPDGALIWFWGANGNGQLGNGSTVNSAAPVPVRSPFAGP